MLRCSELGSNTLGAGVLYGTGNSGKNNDLSCTSFFFISNHNGQYCFEERMSRHLLIREGKKSLQHFLIACNFSIFPVHKAAGTDRPTALSG
jgi:hypothetical protein